MNFVLFLTDLPPGRPFGMDAQTLLQIVANFINFSVLATLMALLLYRPVREVLRKRNEKIQGQLKTAEDTMAMATQLRLAYEQKMKDIAAQRDEVLSEARKEAAELSRELLADAKKEASAMREHAAAEVDAEWERAKPGMKDAIFGISAVMASKFVTLTLSDEARDKLLAQTIAELEDNGYVASHR